MNLSAWRQTIMADNNKTDINTLIDDDIFSKRLAKLVNGWRESRGMEIGHNYKYTGLEGILPDDIP